MNKASTTRLHILNKAFELIYINGYQATSIDRIIETTQVTKGAFYYHFKDKEQMGLAMIDDVLFPRLKRILIDPLNGDEEPIMRIYKSIKSNLVKKEDFFPQYGCPMNNLIQEMSPLNEKFRKKLKNTMNFWRMALIEVLNDAKGKNNISSELDTVDIANFIIVSYEGLRATGKVEEDLSLYESYLKQLKFYLYNLK